MSRVSVVLVAMLVMVGAAAADPALLGPAAFNDWRSDQPGVRRLILPADLPPPFSTRSASNAIGLAPMPTDAKPTVPAGFTAEMLAKGYQQPRVVRVAPNGDLFVADSSANTVHVLRLDARGMVTVDSNFAADLNQPYGIAFYPQGDTPQWVYVANTDSVVRYPYASGQLKAAGPPETIIPNVPTGQHWTRDIAFSADGKALYLSVGSNSNMSEDVHDDPKEGLDKFVSTHPLGEMWDQEMGRAAVLAYDPNGKDERVLATGLRNCSGLTVQPASGAIWCVVNERDGLGDDLVPDFATSVRDGAFYGWPWYYIGANEDPRSLLKGKRPDLKGKVTIPDILFQAHSAPLNIVFYNGTMFPAEYKGDAFVAMHGSWNRHAPTGYKVVRVLFHDGKPTGEYEDFMTGFNATADTVWGRPVGVAVAHDGSLIVTEDGSGTIWRVSHVRGNLAP